MPRIFWVSCPKCLDKFYCHYQELRHKPFPLLCPYCGHRFHQEESKSIQE